MSNPEIVTPKLLRLVGYEHPLLRQVMPTVKFPLSAEDKQIIKDMQYSFQPEQLKAAGSPWATAVGMAANQWGINKRIFLFCPDADSVNGLEVIINPSYEAISDPTNTEMQQELNWEACFSVPLATGNVQRALHIKVQYQNEAGETLTRELHGLPARIWQHETDHLNGLLYDDCSAAKCIEKHQFSCLDEVEKFYGPIREVRKKRMLPCSCGSGKKYKDCCEIAKGK